MDDSKDRNSVPAAAGTPRSSRPPSPTAAQLRDNIDGGRTQDKVAQSDPAAAPLGTDDEAAGAPPTAEQVAIARRQEAGRNARDPSPDDQPPKGAGMASSGRFVWIIVGLVVVCALAGIVLSI